MNDDSYQCSPETRDCPVHLVAREDQDCRENLQVQSIPYRQARLVLHVPDCRDFLQTE